LKLRLIYFCGTDGSGKTTQARRLYFNLRKKAIKAKVVNIRGAMAFRPIIPLFSRMGILSISAGTPPSQRFYLMKCGSRYRGLWTALMLCFFTLSALLRVRFPLLRGYVVICDRYVLDLFAELVAITDVPVHHLRNGLGRVALGVSGIADGLTVMLSVGAFEAMNRKQDILDETYHLARRAIYERVAEEFQVPIVASDARLSDTNRMIDQLIERWNFRDTGSYPVQNGEKIF